MSPEQITGLLVTLVVMIVGVVGSLLPVLPGLPIVFVAALLHRLVFGAAGASTMVLALMGGLMVFSMVLDAVGSMIGARKLGSTWRGVVGASVGAIVGLFFMPFGLILGPFLGAVAGELLGGRKGDAALKAGGGAVLGLLLGALGKLLCGLVMILLFVASVISRRDNFTPPASQFASVFHHPAPQTSRSAPLLGSRALVQPMMEGGAVSWPVHSPNRHEPGIRVQPGARAA